MTTGIQLKIGLFLSFEHHITFSCSTYMYRIHIFQKQRTNKMLSPKVILYWITGPASVSSEKQDTFSFLLCSFFPNTILWPQHDAFKDSTETPPSTTTWDVESKICFRRLLLGGRLEIIKWHWDVFSCTWTNKWQVRWRYVTSEESVFRRSYQVETCTELYKE